jgi:hypothetical protein
MPLPLLAAALAPVGAALARRGLDLLSGVFRGTLDKGTEEITAMIETHTGIDVNNIAEDKLTEDQWIKLKEFELQYQEKLLAYRQSADAQSLELARLDQQDRANARHMQTQAMENQDSFVRRFIYYYALLITVCTFAFVFWAAFGHDYTTHGEDSRRIIDTVLGFVLGVSLSAIIQFFFGSSQGSANKQEQIKELTEQVASLATERQGRGA